MTDTQWFRRSNGAEFEEAVDSPTYVRLVNDPEYDPIDGEGGDVVELEVESEEEPEEVPPAEEPFVGYDDATIEEILPQLEDLSSEELDAVEAYEVANKNRTTLLEAISGMREAPEEE